jgi:hypothetical protein
MPNVECRKNNEARIAFRLSEFDFLANAIGPRALPAGRHNKEPSA